jgi:iron(III) transport system substrate-binding protein
MKTTGRIANCEFLSASLSLGLIFIALGGFAGTQLLSVTVYCSVDEVYARPILQAFQKKTGVRVDWVFDVEATKTAGLVAKLISEKNHPRADVFWSGEVSRTLVLKQKGVLQPYLSPVAKDIPATVKDRAGYWTGLAPRARVIGYNTKLVRPADAPRSLNDLTNPKWRGLVAISDPRFGTASAWAAALFVAWGEKKAMKFFEDLKNNDVKVLPGNSVVADQIARGEILVGVTDTDDVWTRKLDGKPIDMVYPDQRKSEIGTLVIPNSVALIRGARHPEEGKKLIDYLLSAEVEAALARSRARQMPIRSSVPVPKGATKLNDVTAMRVDWDKVADALPRMEERLKSLLRF